MTPHPSRRLRVLTAGVVALLAASAAACSSEPETREPKKVTRLIYAVPAPSQEAMNPNRDLAPGDEYQLKPLYENLIGSDPKTGNWIPMLAESWELEGSQLTFTLRKGVKFHNDKGEFTAADVEYSYNDLVNPPGAISGVAEAMRSAVERIEIVSDYEIAFHLRQTSYKFMEGLGYGSIGMAIKSKADAESRASKQLSLDDQPIAGTGPYQFLERTPGQRVVFKKVPYQHWRQNAGFEELEFRYINENATRMSALLAGEAHVTVLPDELTAEAANSGAKVIRGAIPGRRIGMLLLGCYYKEPPRKDEKSAAVYVSGERKFPDSPMCDVRVRRAINKAIDRDALNKAFYGGKAEPMVMWYWQPELPGFNPAWQERWQDLYGYDPEAAKRLIQEAGYAPGQLRIEVVASPDAGGPESADVSEAVAGMLSDAGIDAPIVSLDYQKQKAGREAREYKARIEFDSTSSEPITGFEPQGYANQDSGRAVEDVALDSMYEPVLVELDPAKQAVLWQAFGDKVFEAVQHVPLLRIRDEAIVDPSVVGDYTFPGAMNSERYAFVEYITPAG
ncbi:ABC transporter substrate-binding protein [Phytohabitans kaempferiae]|uniref:ABC transporter substrate-binding protein n=1 Tax=Phytohabitans kaempferiae TaxID=1620943 RepID=A0ABV6M618_9ACTN